MKTIVCAIYNHPEAFPPTLNGVEELSGIADKLVLLYRPLMNDEWNYPRNVQLFASGQPMTLEQQESSPVRRKVRYFLGFVNHLRKACKYYKPQVVLLYDHMALYAYHLIRKSITHEHAVWYHNHDIADPQALRKYSLGWLAARSQQKAMKYLAVFSLPAQERLDCFNLKAFSGKYFLIPNFPSKKFYARFYNQKQPEHEIRLIYQGTAGPGHGLEQLILLLNNRVNGKALSLCVKGKCRPDYKFELEQRAKAHNTLDRVKFYGLTSYSEVPKVSATCHIGIAIFDKTDVMNRTLGTASNKIYEYAATGLPILFYDNEHFRRHLSRYNWAFPVDLSAKGLLNAIREIDNNYASLSAQAHADFETNLNFEHHFREVKEYIRNLRVAGKPNDLKNSISAE